MKKFENVDIVKTMYEIVNASAGFYRSDFERDIRNLTAAAEIKNTQDRHLLWVTGDNGTYCCREKNVFMQNTPAYANWTQFANYYSGNYMAYAIDITSIENGVIKGNIIPIDYQKHCEYVKKNAIPAVSQIVHYENGDIEMDIDTFGFLKTHEEYGEYIGSEYKPENAEKLHSLLNKENQNRSNAKTADIKQYISDLTTAKIEIQFGKMSTNEKSELIGKIEKPSIRKQLANLKGKSEQKKSIRPKKEDISL